MKKFLIKISIFIGALLLIMLCSMFLPATPKGADYYLFSKKTKDSLLKNVESPRIIFIGGSNLVFGINSRMIKDSLDVNPINTGVTATVGLIYMMDNTLPYVKKGDIVVLCPEYNHYFGKFAYGGNDLIRVLFDIDYSDYNRLRMKQWTNIVLKSPNFSVSKFNPKEYFNYDLNPSYRLNIFNEFGDSKAHWKLDQQEFDPITIKNKKINPAVIHEIQVFNQKVLEKGAQLVIGFPGFQTQSYEINREQIEKVYKKLLQKELKVLGAPERYKMPDSLMFDTPYHLLKEGVDIRTNRIIEDLKSKDELDF